MRPTRSTLSFGRFDFDRLADWLYRFALLFPLVLVAVFFLTVATIEAKAQEKNRPTCGTDLSAELTAEQKRAISEKAAKVPAGEGIYWRIEKAGIAPSHLLGTIHVADKRVTELPEPIDADLRAADRLAVEVTEIGDTATAMGALFAKPDVLLLPNGQTLDDLIGAERRKKVDAMLEGRGIPPASVRTLKPWFIALNLAAPDCAALQAASPADVLDGTLIARKRADGSEVIGLETVEDQLSAISSLPMDAQIEQLVALADFGDRMNDTMETMIQLYLKGHIARIMPTLEAAFPNGGMLVGAGEGYAAVEKTLIDDRNLRMVEAMEPLLKKGHAFVAVGALHLPGENGIVETLRNRGWSVTRAE
ncbi:MAG: TraB/GumN family protein [Fulvimarina manganoxydans]|uniref:TraB/GumN family protein n=1 Tax=Fulvimarina manganoxydans TaxID=937218 RepID=UPI0023578464|nr:TraB/GumN family protein [Fulvimarina manganoxydans]MCK5931926.1 TraB/GumN family protein [Fulvimarina manganoxydans]